VSRGSNCSLHYIGTAHIGNGHNGTVLMLEKENLVSRHVCIPKDQNETHHLKCFNIRSHKGHGSRITCINLVFSHDVCQEQKEISNTHSSSSSSFLPTRIDKGCSILFRVLTQKCFWFCFTFFFWFHLTHTNLPRVSFLTQSYLFSSLLFDHRYSLTSQDCRFGPGIPFQ
jgi:hypothetical protein